MYIRIASSQILLYKVYGTKRIRHIWLENSEYGYLGDFKYLCQWLWNRWLMIKWKIQSTRGPTKGKHEQQVLECIK